MYSTPWCGYCHRLKDALRRDGLSFAVVDIDADPAAADVVRRINSGNATVPTLLFDDGTALTNPTAAQVKAKLGS